MEKERFDLENFPTSESAKRMLSYVSEEFYERSYVGKWLYQVMGMEYDSVREIMEELPLQLFPETATWGLAYHEMKWGLPVRDNLPYEERRRLIYEKRDYRAPMTPYRMEKYLSDVTGFEVHIADINDPGEYGFTPSHPNVFKAYFLGEGTLDYRQVYKTLSRLKQSHTIFSVTDRIEVIFDNRDVENLIFHRLVFHITFPFWRCRVFDGAWLLDGSVMMDQKRCYGLAVRLASGMSIKMSEGIRCAIRTVMAGVMPVELIGCRVFQCLSVRQQETVKENVKFLAGIDSMTERIGEAEVITKTPDYWLLDGSVLLDGSRKLDSIFYKETME